MSFVRFVIAARDPDSGRQQGILQAMFDLERCGALSCSERAAFTALSRWFNTSLACPTRFNRKRNARHRRPRALSWFRDGAHAHLRKMRQIAALLEGHGVHVRMLVTDRPGYVVYQDALQVVAEPFSDTCK